MFTARCVYASFLFVLVVVSSGCERNAVSAPANQAATASPFKVTASIQDIMRHEVDPSADVLWEAVSTTVTPKGTVEKHPQTDEEWREMRHRAITLMEATNLLVMDGRKVLNPGETMEDEGVQGVLLATEVQATIDANRQEFVAFAHALHDVAEQMLKAVDAKSPQGMLDAGEGIDSACEGCHMRFWYPGQVIPEVPK